MQKSIWFIIGIVLALLIGVIFVLNGNQKQAEKDGMQQLSVSTHDFQKVLAYENDFMGNASNMNNLFNNLPLSNYKGAVELDSESFIFTVNYDTVGDDQTVIYNATAAFVLIKNLEVIEMRFTNQSYVITRENVEKWFGSNLDQLTDPARFKEKVQKPLMNDDGKGWLD